MRPLLILSLLLLVFPQPTSAFPDPEAGGRTASVTAHGLRLTVAAAGTTYPRNALVRVTVHLENVSNRPVGVWTRGEPEFNGVIIPQPQVLDRAGHVVYPPALSYLPQPSAGPPPYPQQLPPHIVLSLQTYVILRGTRLRAVATGADRPGDLSSHLPIKTPFLSFTLTKPDTPRLRLQAPGSAATRPLAVTISRPSHAAGPMLYMESIDCLYSGGTSALLPTSVGVWWHGSSPGARLTAGSRSTRLAPHCQPVTATSGSVTATLIDWHLVAGWPDHSVRSFDYPAAWIPPSEIGPGKS